MRKILLIALMVVLGATLSSLVAIAEEQSDEGLQLYVKKCAMCHGKDGVAKKMGAGSANFNDPEWREATSVEDIIKVTTEGKAKMPKYEDKLTPEQIKLVATYVKQIK